MCIFQGGGQNLNNLIKLEFFNCTFFTDRQQLNTASLQEKVNSLHISLSCLSYNVQQAGGSLVLEPNKNNSPIAKIFDDVKYTTAGLNYDGCNVMGCDC